MLLGSRKELLSLQSSLELGTRWRTLRSSKLWRICSSSGSGSSIEKHSDSGQAHEHVLNILIVLVLGYNLLSKIHLFLNKSLLVLSIGVVVVPVDRSASQFDASPFSISLPNLKCVHNRFNPFFPKLLLLFDSPSLPADHPLLVLLCHIFFVCDRFV